MIDNKDLVTCEKIAQSALCGFFGTGPEGFKNMDSAQRKAAAKAVRTLLIPSANKEEVIT